jgi:hypothetical protein
MSVGSVKIMKSSVQVRSKNNFVSFNSQNKTHLIVEEIEN